MLLVRRGSPSVATTAGLRLIRHHDEVALLAKEVSEEMGAAAPGAATLRIAVNADSLATWILPALAKVPDVLFDLVIDDQEVSEDWLRRGEVVAAVTSNPSPLQGCDTVPLGALRYHATASPDYVTRWFPDGVTAQAIAKAPALVFSDKDRLQMAWVEKQGLRSREMFPSHRLASAQGFVDACLVGLGWGMNPELLIREYLHSGQLVELIADTPLDVPLYWQFARVTAGAVSALTQAMRAAAAGALVPIAAS